MLNEVVRMGPQSTITGVLIKRRRYTRDVHKEIRLCEDTARRQPSASQRERPQGKPDLLKP